MPGLAMLARDLRRVVQYTMQPAHASLCLRDAATGFLRRGDVRERF
jgi:hypothetical protein